MTTANTSPLETGPEARRALKAQAVRASLWTFGGYFASRSMRLASNLILTRLLMPDAFGLMAMVGVFTQGLQMFSDVGIGPSIIQNKRGDEPDYLNTAWTIAIIRGFTLWIVSCAIAWPVAHLYDMEELVWLIPVAGFSAVLGGFTSTHIHTLNRHLDLSKENLLGLGAKAVSLVVTVVAAIITRSVWALVIGGLVASTVTMIFSHTLIPGQRNRLRWDSQSVRELFSFGRWIFLSTALTFLAMSTDRLMLGTYIPEAVLGVYAIAYLWYDVPRSLVMRLAGKVIFPAMSKARELSVEEFRYRVAKNRAKVLPLLALGLALVIAFADVGITILYPPEYGAAGWMLAILALGLWCRTLDQTISPALMVFHKLQYNPIGSILRFALIGAGIPIAFSLENEALRLPVAVVIVAAGDVPNYIAYAWGLWRNGLSLLGQDMRMTLLLAVLVGAMLGGRWALGFGLPIDDATQPVAIAVDAPDEAEAEGGGT